MIVYTAILYTPEGKERFLAAEALRKRYDKWSDSELVDEYLELIAGRIPNPTL